MDINSLLDSLSSLKQDVPGEVAIMELRRSPVDELQRRLRKLLKAGGAMCDGGFDRGDWTTYDDRTLVRLPGGAHAVVYHPSGGMKMTTGLAPMESIFKEMEAKSALAQRVEEAARALGVSDNMARGETLSFERLWQAKACAADPKGRTVEPVLCRAIGAFRHHVEGLPVLGPASVAVRIAGGGALDSVTMLMRGPIVEMFEKAKTLHPERAVRQIGQQLTARFGQAKGEVRLANSKATSRRCC